MTFRAVFLNLTKSAPSGSGCPNLLKPSDLSGGIWCVLVRFSFLTVTTAPRAAPRESVKSRTVDERKRHSSEMEVSLLLELVGKHMVEILRNRTDHGKIREKTETWESSSFTHIFCYQS